VSAPPQDIDAWRRISSLLDAGLELDAPARERWLADIAAKDPSVAARLRELFSVNAGLESSGFLENAVVDSAELSTLVGASMAGKTLGAYTIERLVGRGGMGTVWLAHRSDGRFEGRAAVKLLNIALVGHPAEQRFRREGHVLARLQHANIAHLLDAGIASAGQPYLVLEYVPGERIDHYCERVELSLEQRIRLFLDVLGAVAHAHNNLIVHRDIKPSNVLVTEAGVVKLLDFGVAALLSAEDADPVAQHTLHAAAGLTPGFAAPEQLLREPITTATDVYALGLVLYVLLTGRHPAPPDSKTPEQLMRHTLDADLPLPSAVVADARLAHRLRGDLDNIVAMATRRNPLERYATVEQFAADLRRHLALEPVSARPRSFRYLAAKFVRRHRASVAAAAAFVALLVGATVITTLQSMEARRQRDVARFQAHRAEASQAFLRLLMLTDLGPAGNTQTFHDRLELGVELLDKAYRDDPQFSGHMLVELANDYRGNGETERANELYARAYDVGHRLRNTELMAFSQCNRAFAETSAGLESAALQRIEEARVLLGQLRHPDVMLQVSCLRARARFAQRRGESATAEPLLREALRILEANDGTRRGEYVSTLIDLGGVHLSRHQPRESLRLLQQAASILDRTGRGGTRSRFTLRQNISVTLGSMGEISAALAESSVILQQMQARGSGQQASVIFQSNHAAYLARMARPVDALRTLDGLGERARHDGSRYMHAGILLTAARAQIVLKQWDQADASLKEAATLAAEGDRSTRALLESHRAELDRARGDIHSAHQHAERALVIAGHHTDNPQIPLMRILLVSALPTALAEHAFADAERYARDALALAESTARGSDTSADVGEALLRLAQARALAGAHAGTRPLLERAVRCLTNGLRADHPLVLEARDALTHARD
jgi:eukaryotic-like serine/threonine-protein kinase